MYTLEPPRDIKIFLMKFSIFTGEKKSLYIARACFRNGVVVFTVNITGNSTKLQQKRTSNRICNGYIAAVANLRYF